MQREKLSALMDGEVLEPEFISTVSQDSALQQRWESYHLIRDTLRGDTGEVVHFDIASQVALALENEPVQLNPQAIPESQPTPAHWGHLSGQKFVLGRAKLHKSVWPHVFH